MTERDQTERRQIIAMGGGGFSMEPSPLLDDYALRATGKEQPRVCFLPTASGDSDNYVVRFYRAFARKACAPTHVELFRRDERALADVLLSSDLIYVGGGNTANMLAVWKLHGVDAIVRQAWEQGIVLAGVSAGAVCWFEGGTTDSFGPGLEPLEGLGLLPGSFCPHYDGEERRRPRYHELVTAGRLAPGHAADDGAAVHFLGTTVHAIVASSPVARAYRLSLAGREPIETELDTVYLG